MLSSVSLLRCGGLRLAVVPKSLQTQLLSTRARLGSEAKTPIQKWGWDYLVKQESLKRPLSPHLTVYKPMLTWMMSGGTRISGVVMGFNFAYGMQNMGQIYQTGWSVLAAAILLTLIVVFWRSPQPKKPQ